MEITHNLDFPMLTNAKTQTNTNTKTVRKANKQATKSVQSSTMQQRRLMVKIHTHIYLYILYVHIRHIGGKAVERVLEHTLVGQSVSSWSGKSAG